ncbi:MAG: hypothetical protein LIR50_18900, partial [Bacillota bacterium]|nr:hypothetical protein [Bacillota bacterium]
AEIIMKIDSYELNLGVGKLMALSDYLIFNIGKEEKLIEDTDYFLSNLNLEDKYSKLKILNNGVINPSRVEVNIKPFQLYKEKYL